MCLPPGPGPEGRSSLPRGDRKPQLNPCNVPQQHESMHVNDALLRLRFPGFRRMNRRGATLKKIVIQLPERIPSCQSCRHRMPSTLMRTLAGLRFHQCLSPDRPPARVGGGRDTKPVTERSYALNSERDGGAGDVERRERMGGLLNFYCREVA